MIVSDERTSYALFNYPNADQFQWSGSAVIGYVASDLSTFENHVLSHNDSIISVVSSSNVGVPGRYLYRVSGTVGCESRRIHHFVCDYYSFKVMTNVCVCSVKTVERALRSISRAAAVQAILALSVKLVRIGT